MRLHDYLEYHARQTPDHPHLQMAGRVLSYRQANLRANRLAHALRGSGLRPGDRFAWLSRNAIDMALMYFAASKIGAVPVPLNYRLTPREWADIVAESGSRLVLCQAEFAAGLAAALAAGIAAGIGPPGPARRDALRTVALDGRPEGLVPLEDWLGARDDNPGSAPTAEDTVYQMYTSGTTGLPRGVVLTHAAVDNDVQMLAAAAALRPGVERLLLVAPLYHAAGVILLMTGTARGGTLVVHQDFQPAAVVDALAGDGITLALLVPAMLQACLGAVPDLASRAFPTLRTMLYGASPIAASTLTRAMAAFGCDFLQGYGLTETTAIATILDADAHRRALADAPGLLLSAGRPMMGTEIRVVDAQDQDRPPGEIGEVLVRGPQLMTAYWHAPDATAQALRGGWLHTGDVGWLDAEGYLYIRDRLKDVIVSGGENLYSSEIEQVVATHPAVADVAVVGVPDERWGEVALACVVLHDGESLDLDALRTFCRDRLAGFKIPRRLEIVARIPRNASGKILKNALREPHWRGHERRVN
jgi:acyl-CoA synthetase (AMP-forming)/AMP-acid ligase II